MLPKKTFALVHVRISFKTFLHVRATLDVDISVFPCHCPTLNNEIMNYQGSSDVSWTGLGLGVKQERRHEAASWDRDGDYKEPGFDLRQGKENLN